LPEEKAWKNLSLVSARTTQADTVQYKNNEQYNTQKKNSNTELATIGKRKGDNEAKKKKIIKEK
jgi:hypothetical protein